MSDSEISLDFSGVTGISFGPLPSGDYGATIETCEYQLSKSGTPMLNIKFNIDFAMDGSEIPDGKKAFKFLPLSEKSLPYAKPFFDAISDTSAPINFTPSQLVGYTVGLTLGQATYNKTNEDGTKTEVRNNSVEGFFKLS